MYCTCIPSLRCASFIVSYDRVSMQVSARLGQLADPFTERSGEWEDESGE